MVGTGFGMEKLPRRGGDHRQKQGSWGPNRADTVEGKQDCGAMTERP